MLTTESVVGELPMPEPAMPAGAGMEDMDDMGMGGF